MEVFHSIKDLVATRGSGYSNLLVRRPMQITVFCIGFAVLLMFLICNYPSPFRISTISNYFNGVSTKEKHESRLESILRNASMENNTVIITNLNDAWAEPGSIFDVFRESFRIGNETQRFLNHLVVINWDQKAQVRCQAVHPHCYQIESKSENATSKEAFFMTKDYLHIVWKKIEFLGLVLQLGYSFIFTDTDVMWLRNPFKHFQEDADFQTSCDYFTGNSSDMNNAPNTGFSYVKSNEKTIWLYKFWFNSSKLYPNLHDQDAFNMIKIHPNISSMNLKIRFLSTTYFGGFCRPSDDFNQVCTMHANCCVGLDNKVNDLKILLQDWKNYMALPQIEKQQSHRSWTVPQLCRTSFQRMHQRHNKR
ncbi:uncharacterized protein At4g15970-like isoform X1 [Arachis duranensis]|uniref:Glycosyltransferase n=1 Tax=Arachis duranensis TaxID=130453 RepID=A0A6P4DH83_ARADU|nr:uncharacterized protein At4g15970-like isoform X1 [Arachis duranensis]XP_020998959.1 uncharacterized protein At4g15970-like isoform X1 [Arachis duranensis]XP_057763206.1 uncharacterized protein At4g15970-like [Arachis stenosperma]XP_057763207.1 uncharacterized protein At4g15970-like [Arachis stenosperma]